MADFGTLQIDLKGFLKFNEYSKGQHRPSQDEMLKKVLDWLVPGDKTEQEKLQYIRDKVAAGRRVV